MFVFGYVTELKGFTVGGTSHWTQPKEMLKAKNFLLLVTSKKIGLHKELSHHAVSAGSFYSVWGWEQGACTGPFGSMAHA